MDVRFSLSAYIVFEAVAGAGFLFLVLTLLFGEILGRSDESARGVDPFSTRALSAFVLAFGVAGMYASSYGLRPLVACLAAATAGMAGWAAELAAQRLFSGRLRPNRPMR
jgi:hypothetical protein